MKKSGGFSLLTFPASRQFTLDVGKLGQKKHHIKALIEIDVTDSRKKLRKRRGETGGRNSFTAWAVKCIAEALSKHRQVHALRKGRNKCVIFHDVDISIIVEKNVNGVPVPLPLVIREVNRKSIEEVFGEIEDAKASAVRDSGDYVIDKNGRNEPIGFFSILPQCIRLVIWKLILSNPFRVRKMMGTALVTAVGMMGRVHGWFIPYSIHPVSFSLGSIVKKPGAEKGNIEVRDFLEMTILIDHDVVDGAPAARFVAYLNELMKNGFAL